MRISLLNRRELLARLAALGVAGIPTVASGQTRPLNILWRNAWAVVNIGDIGHVPGALALLRHYVPEATVTLWAQQDLVFRGAIARRARFAEASVDATTVSRKVIPDLKVIYGRLDEAGRADNPDLEAAVAAAGMMVVGSGAGVNAGADLLRFHARTSRPIGIFGATTDPFNFTNFADGDASIDVRALRACRFVFTRERTSLRLMDGEDVDGPDGAARDNPKTTVNETIDRSPITVDLRRVNKAFVPDTAFAFQVRDDAWADAFMKTHGLQEGRFVCVLPRHRWTPNDSPTRQGESREVYNTYYAKEDHGKLQMAITTYVRRTGHKVALVPETIYAMDVLGPWLKDGLPADVTGHVVASDRFWLPDAAQSLFARAQAVISLENHSPLLAAAAGTPFVMVHQPEDSFKGDMFIDIGLSDWYVPDVNRATGDEIAGILMRIVSDMPAARAKLATAMALVKERHRFGMMEVRRTLGLPADGTRGFPDRVYR
jgi:hypothetical protein